MISHNSYLPSSIRTVTVGGFGHRFGSGTPCRYRQRQPPQPIPILVTYLILIGCVCGILGRSPVSDDPLSLSIITPSTSTPDLCELLNSTKISLASKVVKDWDSLDKLEFVGCDVRDNCGGLVCGFLWEGVKLKTGVDLLLCQPKKSVKIWAESKHLARKKWSMIHTLVLGVEGVGDERVEVKINPDYVPVSVFSKVFVKVHSSESPSLQHIYLEATLQSCENDSESSCKNYSLFMLSLPVKRLTSSCGDQVHHVSSKRSSRSASDTNNEISSHKPGEQCDPTDIMYCGNGAQCVVGVCHCLPSFGTGADGFCTEKRGGDVPNDPSSDFPNGKNSTSAALGALFAVVILMAVAATVYFGTKHNVFSRIRSRLPLSLRCWPWPHVRRSSPLEDNVSMLNPIDTDDDEPLLL